MFGIVYGLFRLGTHLADPERISFLLQGVRLAMTGSFTGLLLTLINSSFVYRYAKYKRDARKNDYYNFIQIQLLPVLSDNMASSLKSIGSQLSKFNREFSGNINSLNVKLSGNIELLEDTVNKLVVSTGDQIALIKELENIGISKFANHNFRMYENLNKSVDKVIR